MENITTRFEGQYKRYVAEEAAASEKRIAEQHRRDKEEAEYRAVREKEEQEYCERVIVALLEHPTIPRGMWLELYEAARTRYPIDRIAPPVNYKAVLEDVAAADKWNEWVCLTAREWSRTTIGEYCEHLKRLTSMRQMKEASE